MASSCGHTSCQRHGQCVAIARAPREQQVSRIPGMTGKRKSKSK